jgi:DNA (cytosine-5)-methyltransferase 1
VTGVDLAESPRYVGDSFIQGDALTVPLEGYDFVWASPPCQAFTAYRRRPNHVRPRENLIPQVRERLSKLAVPYVIENVHGAPLVSPVMLCGSAFGLDVRRHRFFEASFPIERQQCRHDKQLPRFPCATNRKNLRSTVEVGVYRIPLVVQREAMGIDWMSLPELSQSIPPAYAQYIACAAKRYIG